MQTPGRRRSSSADGSGSVVSSLTRRFVARIVADRDEPTMNAKQLLGLFTEVPGRGILRSSNAELCIGPRYSDQFGRPEHTGPRRPIHYMLRTGLKMHSGACAAPREHANRGEG
jgi:hypothetical protein